MTGRLAASISLVAVGLLLMREGWTVTTSALRLVADIPGWRPLSKDYGMNALALWDGRTCPPCRGSGQFVVDRFDGTAEVVACPWCGGDGKTATERAELVALERIWGGGVGG